MAAVLIICILKLYIFVTKFCFRTVHVLFEKTLCLCFVASMQTQFIIKIIGVIKIVFLVRVERIISALVA